MFFDQVNVDDMESRVRAVGSSAPDVAAILETVTQKGSSEAVLGKRF